MCQQLGLSQSELGWVPRCAAQPDAEIKPAGHTPKPAGHCAKRDLGVCPDKLEVPYISGCSWVGPTDDDMILRGRLLGRMNRYVRVWINVDYLCVSIYTYTHTHIYIDIP